MSDNIEIREDVQQALHESEGKYRTLIDSIDEAFCVIEVLFDESRKAVDYRFLEVNTSFEKQTGIENAVGKRMRDIAPEHEDHWFEIYGQVALTGVPARFENHAEQLGRWYDVYAFRIGNAREKKVAILFKDITERKQTEDRIERLNNLNREILESITDAFFAVDRGWRFTYVNPQAETMLDRKHGDLIGQVIWEVYPGLIGSEFEQAYLRAADERESSSVVSYYPDHDRWYDVNVYPAPNGITIYFRDVTKTMKADEALQRSRDETERQRRLYDTFLSNTPDLAYVFDREHRFIYANEVLLQMWGKSRDEAIGKNCLELGYEPWHAEMHDREIEQVVATKQPIRGEVPFDGTFGRRIYDYIFVPIFGEDGEVEGIAGTTRDITDRQQMEAALREADRRKDEFLATLAHELRNPLAPIRSGLEIIRRAGDDQAKIAETIDIIERQTNQMVHLVDDLLDISRITQGKVKLRCERIELKTAIEMALETSRDLIDEAANELTVTFPYKPIYIDADLTRIAQIFLNILNNAAKYSDPGGKISLVVSTQANEAIISIKDTGLGIPPEMLSKIFEMFGQLETPGEETRGGLGIGLSVVKELVEMHGGTIEAKSEGEGKGSEFIVKLPLANEPSKQIAKSGVVENRNEELMPDKTPVVAESAEATNEIKSRKILVVDDNADAAELLETLLSFEGHIVRKAFDGKEGLAEAEEFQPEICLLDIGLPGMSGYELATHLRQLLPESLLISVSGWGQDEDRRRSKESGFNFHLVKPVQFEEILKLIM